MIPIVAALMEQGLSILGGAILSKGKAVVEEKLGVKIPDSATPEDFRVLKQLEFQHEEWLIDAGIRKAQQDLDTTKVYLADVQDARAMQGKALAQDDLFTKRFVYYFAIVIFGFTCLYVTAITFVEIPQQNLRFADTVMGFLLGTLLATIMNFFYGTSRSSQAKDSTISDAVKQLGKD